MECFAAVQVFVQQGFTHKGHRSTSRWPTTPPSIQQNTVPGNNVMESKFPFYYDHGLHGYRLSSRIGEEHQITNNTSFYSLRNF